MTDAAISRAFVSDIEVRADGTGRTVHGIVVPFDRTARVSDGGPSYMEGFRRGAFARTISHRGDRVKLLSQHNARSNPLGRATLLREDTAGLYGEFHVSKTAAGDEALELLRDGALDSFSVGFSPIQHTRDADRTVWRTEVGLREASLVTFPAYEGALIGGVRSMTPEELDELARMLHDRRPLAGGGGGGGSVTWEYAEPIVVGNAVNTNKLWLTTPLADSAALGTSESPEPARSADEDPAPDPVDHSAQHAHNQNRAKARREGGPLS